MSAKQGNSKLRFLDLCDRVMVMNKGRNVGAFKIEDVNKDDILSLIIKGTLPDNWTPRGQAA